MINIHRHKGNLRGITVGYPPSVKPKKYREEIRRRFCETLLARRVLIVEGRTEFDALPAAARRLSELHPEEFSTLEALGVGVIDAGTDTQIAPLAKYFRTLEKTIFAVYDKQADESANVAIKAEVANAFESPENGFERLITKHSAETALRRHGIELVNEGRWPTNMKNPPTEAMAADDVRESMMGYFKDKKGEGAAAEFLSECTKDEMPKFITMALADIRLVADPKKAEVAPPLLLHDLVEKANDAAV